MNQMHVGIPKPDLGANREEHHLSLNEMRALIIRAGRRDSALVRQCLMRVELEGMSGEEAMTLIAYYALRQLEETHQRLAQWTELHPMPPIIMKDPKLPDSGTPSVP